METGRFLRRVVNSITLNNGAGSQGPSVKKALLPLVGAVIAASFLAASVQPGSADKSPTNNQDSQFLLGQTQCVLQRKGIIAPTVLHPVTEVLVSLGDKVKKDQPLVKIDDDEPQADVRGKKANLENAGIVLRESKRYLASLEKLHSQGAIPEQRLHELRAAALKAEMDERAAKAAVDSALAELEHYTVTAPIDGIINKLHVHPGEVSRPGTTVWGEILDLREIDVRFQITVNQADQLKVGDNAEVLAADLTTSYGTGRVVFIGLEANRDNGKLPALVRLANADGKLRCEVPVRVRLVEPRKN